MLGKVLQPWRQARPDAKGAKADGDMPSGQDVLQLIRSWKWFAYVPAEAHEWLAQRAVIKQIEKDRIVYVSGSPATHIYAVISGMFRIYLTSSRGDDITLEEVVSGGWFPHIAPVDPPTYLINCVCHSDAVVVAFSCSDIEKFAQRWPGYYRGLYHELTSRAVATFGKIELLSLHNLNVRLAVYLLRMAHLRGMPEAGGAVWIPISDSQSEIGARVGGTRQRVNGVLNTWTKVRMIEMHKDGTRILDMARLRKEAGKSGFDIQQYLASWHGSWGSHN